METLDSDFYLVLPSNSSMSYFPDNTTTCFTTQLPREIRLIGEWMVGLAEIHVPCTIVQLRQSEAKVTFNVDSKLKGITYTFPQGVYEKVDQLASVINKTADIGKHLQIEPAGFHRGYFEIKRVCSCERTHSLTLNDKLVRVFGFEGLDGKISDLHVGVGNTPACLARAIPDQLFVYTDICEPRLVGDTQAPLLRIVAQDNSKYKFGTNYVKNFAPIHYVPLLHHSFSNIVIDIRDQHGRAIPFAYGTLTVVLHFKRNS